MFLKCCLLHIVIISRRHVIHLDIISRRHVIFYIMYLCLRLGLFMSYLRGLFFIIIFIFIIVFSLIFCQSQRGVAYKSVAYEKSL